MSKLAKLKGIGKITAQKLIEKGIDSPEKIAIMRPEELSEILGWTLYKAKECINDAKEKYLYTVLQPMSAEDIMAYYRENLQYIPTGSKALDDILGGGISTMAITGVTGRFGTGKTQLAHMLIVNCKRYLDRIAVFIETEPRTFQPDRILEIASNNGVDISLKDIIVFPHKIIYNTNRQFGAYEVVKHRLDKGEDIGLIVVDSFNARFREEYKGREMFTPRSAEMIRHLGYLAYLCSTYNLAVFLTCQVMGVPDSSGQLEVRKTYGIDYALVGGSALKHSITYWLAMSQVSRVDKTWKVALFDGPLPYNEAIIRIDEFGIRDVKGRRGV